MKKGDELKLFMSGKRIPARQSIEVCRTNIELSDIISTGDTFSQVIKNLESLNSKIVEDIEYHDSITNVKFDVSYYGYDGGTDISLVYYRDETDEEMQKRYDLNRAYYERKALQAKKKEEKERAKYLELKAKYDV